MRRDFDRALALAVDAHAGQKDLAGHPYIYHPIRVAMAVEGDETEVVAVLHDVVEDTAIEIWDLRTFGRLVVESVALLTRAPEGSYDRLTYGDYIKRIASAPGVIGATARRVKIADLRDNLRPEGLTPGLEVRYRHALSVLSVPSWRDDSKEPV